MQKIVIATKNQGKLREIQKALQGLAETVSLAAWADLPEPREDGATFAENAVIKAKYYREKLNLPCLADDSGLEVAALDGAPGVHSARFAGYHGSDAANNVKLLEELTRVGKDESAASYRSVLAFAPPEGEVILTEGICRGIIKKSPRGSGGFGYDPYFYLPSGKTMAELTLEEKEAVSHRGEAMRAMQTKLKDFFRQGGAV